jgi:hypothetical protein
LFLANRPILHSALSRAVTAVMGQARVKVMTPEDVVLLKLLSRRKKDLADIEDLVALCTHLDVTYLREWAGRLGIEDRLAEVLP